MDWNSCLRQREAKRIKADEEMASSLEKTSVHKAFSSQLLVLREETAAEKISLSYDAVRELLEAMSLRKGFKIYNHICYTSFLKEILKESDLGREFDELRVIRNDINYYGKEVSFIEAKNILERLDKLRAQLLSLGNKKA